MLIPVVAFTKYPKGWSASDEATSGIAGSASSHPEIASSAWRPPREDVSAFLKAVARPPAGDASGEGKPRHLV